MEIIDSTNGPFHSVVLTSPDAIAAEAAMLGPLKRSNVPIGSNNCPTKIFSTSDPFDSRMGSGGGTLAALAHCDKEIMCSDSSGSVLIIHAGGQSSRCPTQMTLGKAWTDLPLIGRSRTNPTYILMESLSHVLRHLPSGSVVVAASDVIINLPDDPISFDGIGHDKVIGLAVPQTLDTAKNHGVFAVSNGSKDDNHQDSLYACIKPVTCFFQKPSIETMKQFNGCTFKKDGLDQAWIDTGVIVFLPETAKALRHMIQNELKVYTKEGIEKMAAADKRCHDIPIEVVAKSLVKSKLELYSHLLLAISTKSSQSTNANERLKQYTRHTLNAGLCEGKLKQIYERLSPFELQVCIVPKGSFIHLGTTRELSDFLLSGSKEKGKASTSLPLSDRSDVFLKGIRFDEKSLVMNSIIDTETSNKGYSYIGAGSIIEHCYIDGINIKVGRNCVVSGVRGKSNSASFVIPDNMVFQMLPLQSTAYGPRKYVCIYLGINDEIKEKHGQCYGASFQHLFNFTNLNESDVWIEGDTDQLLWNAIIHPVITMNANNEFDWDPFVWIQDYIKFLNTDCKSLSTLVQSSLDKWKSLKRLSLAQIQRVSDASHEFTYRTDMRGVLDKKLHAAVNASEVILKERLHEEIKFDYILHSIPHSYREFYVTIDMFCNVIISSINEKAYDISSRSFMLVGSLIGQIANVFESSESRQLDNCGDKLTSSLQIFQRAGDHEERIASLKVLLEESKSLLKFALPSKNKAPIEFCSNLMEEIASSLTALCVITSDPDLTREEHIIPPFHKWIVSSAPVRIDLSGGWSDTPPVSYEFGGAVACLAVTVNNLKPLSARCRRVRCLDGVILRAESRDMAGSLLDSQSIHIHTVRDLDEFRNPNSKCALLKCAFVALGLIPVASINTRNSTPIANYLTLGCKNDKFGLELISTSLLPRGSGMGTSSILAACVISSLGQALGLTRVKDTNYLIQTVLDLEQLLSTGGGWQDQVGGCFGGLKLCSAYKNELPVQVKVKELQIPEETIQGLNQRLVLAFTGKPRLAKDILVKVLRQWAKRTPEIMVTVSELCEGAMNCIRAIEEENYALLGSLMSQYWELKKVMAGGQDSGVEPESVGLLLRLLKEESVIAGGTLCGAGGGGFLAILLRENKKLEDIKELQARSEISDQFTWFECNVCPEGLTSSIQSSEEFQLKWHF